MCAWDGWVRERSTIFGELEMDGWIREQIKWTTTSEESSASVEVDRQKSRGSLREVLVPDRKFGTKARNVESCRA